MRVGSVGYATCQGLGILMKSFYDASVVTDVAVIAHGSRETHFEWYPDDHRHDVTALRNQHQILMLHKWCQTMDVVLFFETPFIWELIPFCRDHGIKTIMMPMYECMPTRWPYQTDAIINPSLLDQKYYPHGTFIPVPVDPIPYRLRSVARVFVHNAGHGGLLSRNGTAELLQAMRLVKSEAKLLVRSQTRQSWPPYPELLRNTTAQIGTLSSRDQLYAEGDVFVFPEKFNGLSLPLQEATASGMAVMTTNRTPNINHLPDFIPLNVSSYRRNRISGRTVEFDEAVIDPKTIAAKIDEIYGTNIEGYSLSGKSWAESMSWDHLRPRYMEFIRCLLGQH